MWINYKKPVTYYKCTNIETGEVFETRYKYHTSNSGGVLYKYEAFIKYEWFHQWIGKKGYQKKLHHKKKTKDEKEALNAKKRFKHRHKDKKKAGLSNSWSGRSCPKWIKRYCNKIHRQWERSCIEREDYDKLHKRDVKRILDPWRWD
jgi:hypothetical protein